MPSSSPSSSSSSFTPLPAAAPPVFVPPPAVPGMAGPLFLKAFLRRYFSLDVIYQKPPPPPPQLSTTSSTPTVAGSTTTSTTPSVSAPFRAPHESVNTIILPPCASFAILVYIETSAPPAPVAAVRAYREARLLSRFTRTCDNNNNNSSSTDVVTTTSATQDGSCAAHRVKQNVNLMDSANDMRRITTDTHRRHSYAETDFTVFFPPFGCAAVSSSAAAATASAGRSKTPLPHPPTTLSSSSDETSNSFLDSNMTGVADTLTEAVMRHPVWRLLATALGPAGVSFMLGHTGLVAQGGPRRGCLQVSGSIDLVQRACNAAAALAVRSPPPPPLSPPHAVSAASVSVAPSAQSAAAKCGDKDGGGRRWQKRKRGQESRRRRGVATQQEKETEGRKQERGGRNDDQGRDGFHFSELVGIASPACDASSSSSSFAAATATAAVAADTREKGTGRHGRLWKLYGASLPSPPPLGVGRKRSREMEEGHVEEEGESGKVDEKVATNAPNEENPRRRKQHRVESNTTRRNNARAEFSPFPYSCDVPRACLLYPNANSNNFFPTLAPPPPPPLPMPQSFASNSAATFDQWSISNNNNATTIPISSQILSDLHETCARVAGTIAEALWLTCHPHSLRCALRVSLRPHQWRRHFSPSQPSRPQPHSGLADGSAESGQRVTQEINTSGGDGGDGAAAAVEVPDTFTYSTDANDAAVLESRRITGEEGKRRATSGDHHYCCCGDSERMRQDEESTGRLKNYKTLTVFWSRNAAAASSAGTAETTTTAAMSHSPNTPSVSVWTAEAILSRHASDLRRLTRAVFFHSLSRCCSFHFLNAASEETTTRNNNTNSNNSTRKCENTEEEEGRNDVFERLHAVVLSVLRQSARLDLRGAALRHVGSLEERTGVGGGRGHARQDQVSAARTSAATAAKTTATATTPKREALRTPNACRPVIYGPEPPPPLPSSSPSDSTPKRKQQKRQEREEHQRRGGNQPSSSSSSGSGQRVEDEYAVPASLVAQYVVDLAAQLRWDGAGGVGDNDDNDKVDDVACARADAAPGTAVSQLSSPSTCIKHKNILKPFSFWGRDEATHTRTLLALRAAVEAWLTCEWPSAAAAAAPSVMASKRAARRTRETALNTVPSGGAGTRPKRPLSEHSRGSGSGSGGGRGGRGGAHRLSSSSSPSFSSSFARGRKPFHSNATSSNSTASVVPLHTFLQGVSVGQLPWLDGMFEYAPSPPATAAAMRAPSSFSSPSSPITNTSLHHSVTDASVSSHTKEAVPQGEKDEKGKCQNQSHPSYSPQPPHLRPKQRQQQHQRQRSMQQQRVYLQLVYFMTQCLFPFWICEAFHVCYSPKRPTFLVFIPRGVWSLLTRRELRSLQRRLPGDISPEENKEDCDDKCVDPGGRSSNEEENGGAETPVKGATPQQREEKILTRTPSPPASQPMLVRRRRQRMEDAPDAARNFTNSRSETLSAVPTSSTSSSLSTSSPSAPLLYSSVRLLPDGDKLRPITSVRYGSADALERAAQALPHASFRYYSLANSTGGNNSNNNNNNKNASRELCTAGHTPLNETVSPTSTGVLSLLGLGPLLCRRRPRSDSSSEATKDVSCNSDKAPLAGKAGPALLSSECTNPFSSPSSLSSEKDNGCGTTPSLLPPSPPPPASPSPRERALEARAALRVALGCLTAAAAARGEWSAEDTHLAEHDALATFMQEAKRRRAAAAAAPSASSSPLPSPPPPLPQSSSAVPRLTPTHTAFIKGDAVRCYDRLSQEAAVEAAVSRLLPDAAYRRVQLDAAVPDSSGVSTSSNSSATSTSSNTLFPTTITSTPVFSQRRWTTYVGCGSERETRTPLLLLPPIPAGWIVRECVPSPFSSSSSAHLQKQMQKQKQQRHESYPSQQYQRHQYGVPPASLLLYEENRQRMMKQPDAAAHRDSERAATSSLFFSPPPSPSSSSSSFPAPYWISGEALRTLLTQHLSSHPVVLHSAGAARGPAPPPQLFSQVSGIPQGSPVAMLVCNIVLEEVSRQLRTTAATAATATCNVRADYKAEASGGRNSGAPCAADTCTAAATAASSTANVATASSTATAATAVSASSPRQLLPFRSLVLRRVDDVLVATAGTGAEAAARACLRALRQGWPALGYRTQASKLRVSLSFPRGNRPQRRQTRGNSNNNNNNNNHHHHHHSISVRGKDAGVPWCGLLLHAATATISVEWSRVRRWLHALRASGPFSSGFSSPRIGCLRDRGGPLVKYRALRRPNGRRDPFVSAKATNCRFSAPTTAAGATRAFQPLPPNSPPLLPSPRPLCPPPTLPLSLAVARSTRVLRALLLRLQPLAVSAAVNSAARVAQTLRQATALWWRHARGDLDRCFLCINNNNNNSHDSINSSTAAVDGLSSSSSSAATMAATAPTPSLPPPLLRAVWVLLAGAEKQLRRWRRQQHRQLQRRRVRPWLRRLETSNNNNVSTHSSGDAAGAAAAAVSSATSSTPSSPTAVSAVAVPDRCPLRFPQVRLCLFASVVGDLRSHVRGTNRVAVAGGSGGGSGNVPPLSSVSPAVSGWTFVLRWASRHLRHLRSCHRR